VEISVVTVAELGVALAVFAVCAFWIVRHFHGLAEATRDSEDAAQPTRPGYLADTRQVKAGEAPAQSAAHGSQLPAKRKVAESLVRLDLPLRRALPVAAAAITVPGKSELEARSEIADGDARTATRFNAAASDFPTVAVPLPLSTANYAGPRVAPEAATVAMPVAAAVAPAASAFASAAVVSEPGATPSQGMPPHIQTENGSASAQGRPFLISTSHHRTRVAGAEDDDSAWDEFCDMPVHRPQSPSIWSKSLRRVGSSSELEVMTILFGQQSVRAERLPIRAEPRRVGQSELRGRRIRALGLVSATETPSPPAMNVLPIAAPAAAATKSATIPNKSRIKRATKLVGKPRLEPDLKSKPVVATKVLGAEPAPLKSRLPQTRKERRPRTVAQPVRKLYLTAQDAAPEPGALSA
jgi:hypothetical protein